MPVIQSKEKVDSIRMIRCPVSGKQIKESESYNGFIDKEAYGDYMESIRKHKVYIPKNKAQVMPVQGE